MSLTRSLLILVCLSLGCAETRDPSDSWHVDGKPVPDSTWYKADPPFAAQLMVIESRTAPALYDRWENVPGGFHIGRIKKASPGERIETIVFFARCAPDSRGNCRVEGRGRVTTGTGQVLVQDASMLISEKPAPEGNDLGISEIGLSLEPELRHKSYRFEIRVVDQVAGREVTLFQEIEVLE